MAFVFVVAMALMLALLVPSATASSFLARAGGGEVETLDAELQSSIIQKIETMLGAQSNSEDRLRKIQDHLRTKFMAMPKNELGKLDHNAVRYSLHSYFVQHHGWYVRGLSDVGEGFASNDEFVGTSQERVEEFIQGVFEQKMGAHGLSLREMAVLAATFENLVRDEMVQRLDTTLDVLSFGRSRELNVTEVDNVLEKYMMSYLLRIDFSMLRPGSMQILEEHMHIVYPTWDATKKLLQEVRVDMGQHKSFFTAPDVEDMLERVADNYGRWQDWECRDLKSLMTSMEDKSIGINGSGRVRLTDFYGSAVKDGNIQFSETKEYLVQLGILDSHEPSIPRVIIPNYINSPSNCVAGSKYYSVCCINECEDLLDNLEHRFKAPTALPAEILAFVSGLGSSTVAAGRSLSPVLITRLEEIGDHHGGLVPLHGRLFAQWMHHAYPRECPYPHVSGTTRAQRTRDYTLENNRSATHLVDALEQEWQVLLAEQEAAEPDSGDEVTGWSHFEELYVDGAFESHQTGWLWLSLRPVVYLSLIFAAVLALGSTASRGAGARKISPSKDLYV